MPDQSSPAPASQTPPAAVPATPLVPASIDPTRPPLPPAMPSPEDDPNLAMSRLIAKRGEKKAEKAAEEPKKESSDKADAAPEEPPKLTDLIGKALKFTQKPAAKAKEQAAAAPEKPVADKPKEESQPEPRKTTVSKRSPTPEPVDQAAIAAAAASAATQAAVKAMAGNKPAEDKVEDSLSPEDRHDYEVALHLAETNPKYKDAPKVVLNQVAKAQSYAERWEKENPGKAFDPNDDEHNEFFEKLERPWTPAEFRDAEIDLVAERKAQKLIKQQDSKFEELARDNARVELAPVVEKKFTAVGGDLVKLIGDDLHEALASKGYDGLEEKDPVAAVVLTEALGKLHPFIEATIQIDDPRGRIKLDPANPIHNQWMQVVTEGEARCVGQKLDDGRVFAKRADYVRMNEAQRARHWYLTSDMIIQGTVEYAAAEAKRIIETEKKRLERLGFVRKTESKQTPSASQQTHTPAVAVPATPAPAALKPVSPSAGGGAKIDDTAGPVKTGNALLMDKLGEILFRR